ncbi:helix-turn-helix domain-containing protein [Bacteroides thetaiotaomicron]|uniref:helix-turn-helix domain-containing protein n=1 Tax=Bacteroides thetaiotaomicron TaxID=818 RepID=UPI0039C003E0
MVIVYPNSKEYLSGISEFHLTSGCSNKKISKIKASLLDKTIPIKSIAYELGFVDQSHLNAFCKKYLNATPLQIRNSSEVKKQSEN